jgi:hypothetical protein
MANAFYAFVLGFIFTTALIVIFQTVLSPKTGDVEKKINNIVYTMRDSLEAAKLYTETSARYSVYQAMYENGMRGGFNKTNAKKTMERDGFVYSLWYDNGDYSPNYDEFLDYLDSSAEHKFLDYCRGSVLAIFPVSLPYYHAVLVSNLNNYSVSFSAESESKLLMIKTGDDGETIRVEKDSAISETIEAPYFQLFQEAKDLMERLPEKLPACSSGEISEFSRDRFLYTTDVSVIGNSGKCLVKFEGSTKKDFLIWNGEEVALEPIKLVFLVRG